MRRSDRAFAACILILVSLCAGRAGAFEVGSRWNYTATNGSATGGQGSPITLTWSFAPDGTTIPSNVSSNLISFLDTNLGAGPVGSDYTQRPWFGRFQQSFDRLSALSGVTYVYEPNDDGRSFSGTTSARGSLGVRGDIRIGGKSYGAGINTLASNFFPSYGEMMINTDKVSFYTATSNNNRAFRNVIMHEAMHGLGIRHVESDSSGFLIEPIISTSFDGPQLDDLLAIQRLYGDFYEKNGGNDVFAQATPLGVVTPTQSQQLGTLGNSTVIASTQTDFLSIDDDSDTDYFSFSIDSPLDVQVEMTPRGATYMVGPEGSTQVQFNTTTLSDLSLALFDTNGTSLLGLANSNPAGVVEALTQQLLPGTYYARVTGAQNNIQLYGLQVSATTPPAANLVWVGNLSNVWNNGITANFADGGASALFDDFDNVQFDDSSTVKTVNLPSDVSAGQVRITTDGQYVFTGTGGIVAGSVTIDGTGTVELANVGNSYFGPTLIASGTLAITGDANAMRSAMHVSQGARLRVDANTSIGGALFLTGDGAGMGAVRIAAGRNVSFQGNVNLVGNGVTLHAEPNAIAQFAGSVNGTADQSNVVLVAEQNASLLLQGELSLAGGGITKRGAGTAELGGAVSYTGATAIEEGRLRLTGNGALAGAMHVEQQATLELAGSHEFTADARLSGNGQVMGDLLMPGTIAPGDSAGTLTLADGLTLFGTSLLEVELGGAQAGIDFDLLNVGGQAALAGTLQIALIDGFAPTLGEAFEFFIAADGISGAFDSIMFPALADGLMWNLDYQPDSVLLEIAAEVVSQPGDYNGDGIVDATDYTAWRDTLGSTTNLAADGDGSGAVDAGDYDVWTTNFGRTMGASAAAVPEPSAWTLLMVVLTILVYRAPTMRQ